jgi:hypothetical protein
VNRICGVGPRIKIVHKHQGNACNSSRSQQFDSLRISTSGESILTAATTSEHDQRVLHEGDRGGELVARTDIKPKSKRQTH